ncbi:MAG TPA: pyridoxamine 5'-phosphate oxidase [Gemmatimonadaceae bacterium]|nr:pyridoxamine 5'-phosphate oxidase [Gemmatimonadaceae bacterium]
MSIRDLRREYSREMLTEEGAASDPIRQFEHWFDQAASAGVLEPNAMTLATATADGGPSARMVLLKGFDERGFVFYTDYRSRKARELAVNPRAALCFYWPELERQVRVGGAVSRLGGDESAAYFATRPVGSRIAAWASEQSAVIADRSVLEARVAELTKKFGESPPLPDHWGGYRLVHEEVEFWQGRPSRLHDRIRYLREGDRWRRERLSP